jgi:hypothetical protein
VWAQAHIAPPRAQTANPPSTGTTLEAFSNSGSGFGGGETAII